MCVLLGLAGPMHLTKFKPDLLRKSTSLRAKFRQVEVLWGPQFYPDFPPPRTPRVENFEAFSHCPTLAKVCQINHGAHEAVKDSLRGRG